MKRDRSGDGQQVKEEMDKEEICSQLRTTEGDEDDVFDEHYCWQTVRAGSDEATDVQSFPLRRHVCGFHAADADHSTHTALQQRLRTNVMLGTRLAALLWGIQEISDFDCDYSFFAQLVEPNLPDRSLETVRKYLCDTLMLPFENTSIRAIPIDEDHRDKVMIVYPTILDPQLAERHKQFSEAFLGMELQDTFYFRGGSDDGTSITNTYPVIWAGFDPDEGDIIGVYAVRTDT